MSAIEIVEADLARPEHQAAVLTMVDAYSRDPMGDGAPLRPEVRANLIPRLRAHPTTMIFLACAEGAPVGILVAFLGFSTFHARPLINLHDVAVVPAARGRGIGRQLVAAVEEKARALGCCRLTLEVLEGNARARRVYTAAGFGPGDDAPADKRYLFLTKPLT
jgi:GNAT superfamily N-acetyltransferase